MKNWISIIAGFIFLFCIYHFPEFFHPFWITAVFKIGFLAVAILLCRLQGSRLLEGYGLSITGKWYSILLGGLLVGIVSFSLSIVLSVRLNFEELKNIQSFSFFLKSLPLTLVITFFPSIAEDILTRGYLYGHLKSVKPIVWILLSAAIYVLNHIWRLNDDLSVLSYLFLLGLVLSFSVVINKSLWLAFGIHWGANIAYELSNAGLQLNRLGDKNASTWMLSLIWGLILFILIITNRNSLSRSELDDNGL
jgi:membrane protease YdiL (CAAX protease family)